MDFPALSREYGRDGVGLLLVPAWDFDADGWLHGRMAFLRGVEAGFSIVRAPRHGLLSVSDSRGRVLAERSSGAAPFSTVVTQVPVRHEATLYSRTGDWFAAGCIGVLFALLLFARLAAGEAKKERRTRLRSSKFMRHWVPRFGGFGGSAGSSLWV